jgi:hypothetical protein
MVTTRFSVEHGRRGFEVWASEGDGAWRVATFKTRQAAAARVAELRNHTWDATQKRWVAPIEAPPTGKNPTRSVTLTVTIDRWSLRAMNGGTALSEKDFVSWLRDIMTENWEAAIHNEDLPDHIDPVFEVKRG